MKIVRKKKMHVKSIKFNFIESIYLIVLIRIEEKKEKNRFLKDFKSFE